MQKTLNENKYLILGIFLIIAALVGFIFWSRLNQKSAPAAPQSGIIFFYGRECPHCQDVEKFLEENKVAEKVKYDSVEVWHNQDNAKLMMQDAGKCGLAQDKVGVPFVYDAGQSKCYIGTPDAEAFFKDKAGLN